MVTADIQMILTAKGQRMFETAFHNDVVSPSNTLEKALEIFSSAFLLVPATTYFPGQSPAKYHQRERA